MPHVKNPVHLSSRYGFLPESSGTKGGTGKEVVFDDVYIFLQSAAPLVWPPPAMDHAVNGLAVVHKYLSDDRQVGSGGREDANVVQFLYHDGFYKTFCCRNRPQLHQFQG